LLCYSIGVQNGLGTLSRLECVIDACCWVKAGGGLSAVSVVKFGVYANLLATCVTYVADSNFTRQSRMHCQLQSKSLLLDEVP